MIKNTISGWLKSSALLFFACTGLTVSAQEDTTEKKFSLSGSVDAYFRTNFNARNRPEIAPSTSFANGTGFSIGMANVIASYEGEKVGFVADLVFGPRGEAAVFNSDGISQAVNQLYVYWNASDAVKLTFGNFNTYLGYEVISPTGNFNYSTSYMFSFGPFSHTGVKADFTLSDNWSVAAALMNPTDYTENNPFDTYIVGGQVGYSDDSGSAYLNFRYGNEGEPGVVGPTFQVDLTTGWSLSEEFYLGLNTTYLTTEAQAENTDAAGFYGAALYPQYSFSDTFALGLRGEYFAQFNGGLTETNDDGIPTELATAIDIEGDGSVIALTLTGSVTVGDNLTFKPEIRFDSMSEDTFPIFADRDGEASDSLGSFLIGAIYSF